MKAKLLFSGLGMMVAIAIVCLTSSQAFAVEDEWTDYDPCGWNVEQEDVQPELTLAEINEDKWSDYDPCGWNDEQEGVQQELTLAEINEDKWTDYDPCGWNDEQDTVTAEIATVALFNDNDYMN